MLDRFDELADGLNHPEGVAWNPFDGLIYAGGEAGELTRSRWTARWSYADRPAARCSASRSTARARLRVRCRTGRDHADGPDDGREERVRTRRRRRRPGHAERRRVRPGRRALRDVLGRGRSPRDRADRAGRCDGTVDDRGAELSERLPGHAGRLGARGRRGQGRAGGACADPRGRFGRFPRGRCRAPRHRRRRDLARGRRQLLGHALPPRRPRADRTRRRGRDRRRRPSRVAPRRADEHRVGRRERSIAPSSRTSADGPCRSRTSTWPATRSTTRRCRDGSLHRPQRDRDRRRPGDRARHRRGVPGGGSARVRRRHPRRRSGADARRDRPRPRIDAPGRPVRLRGGEGDGDRGHRAPGDASTRWSTAPARCRAGR